MSRHNNDHYSMIPHLFLPWPIEEDVSEPSHDPLYQQYRAQTGQPLHRLDQLDAGCGEISRNPEVRLEYDRFCPRFHKPHS